MCNESTNIIKSNFKNRVKSRAQPKLDAVLKKDIQTKNYEIKLK